VWIAGGPPIDLDLEGAPPPSALGVGDNQPDRTAARPREGVLVEMAQRHRRHKERRTTRDQLKGLKSPLWMRVLPRPQVVGLCPPEGVLA
jgi:hypothetical protein